MAVVVCSLGGGRRLQEDVKKALLESLADIDPANPWVKDASGRHTNVSALLDWPEEEDESENEADALESTELASEAESTCALGHIPRLLTPLRQNFPSTPALVLSPALSMGLICTPLF